jgi:hypothetical protein
MQLKTEHNFEDFLETIFNDLREVGGIGITKDNYENLYEHWLEQLDIQELIDYGNQFAAKLVEQIINHLETNPINGLKDKYFK